MRRGGVEGGGGGSAVRMEAAEGAGCAELFAQSAARASQELCVKWREVSGKGVAHVCVLCELCDECVLQVGGEEFEVVVELHVQHAWLGGRVVLGGLALGLQDAERAERRG